MTKTLSLTQTDVQDIHGALFVQLVEVRRTIREGYGSVALESRLEALCNRLHDVRIAFADVQKVEV